MSGNAVTAGPEKACPVLYRRIDGAVDVLAFRHPLAGNQFIKGSIEAGEAPDDASVRELREESGLISSRKPLYMGTALIGAPPVRWHFYGFESEVLAESWDHWTEDDGGHLFSFFWHPITRELDDSWHPIFHQAFRFIQTRLPPLLG